MAGAVSDLRAGRRADAGQRPAREIREGPPGRLQDDHGSLFEAEARGAVLVEPLGARGSGEGPLASWPGWKRQDVPADVSGEGNGGARGIVCLEGRAPTREGN